MAYSKVVEVFWGWLALGGLLVVLPFGGCRTRSGGARRVWKARDIFGFRFGSWLRLFQDLVYRTENEDVVC